jgi:hypothetical protein
MNNKFYNTISYRPGNNKRREEKKEGREEAFAVVDLWISRIYYLYYYNIPPLS